MCLHLVYRLPIWSWCTFLSMVGHLVWVRTVAMQRRRLRSPSQRTLVSHTILYKLLCMLIGTYNGRFRVWEMYEVPKCLFSSTMSHAAMQD